MYFEEHPKISKEGNFFVRTQNKPLKIEKYNISSMQQRSWVPNAFPLATPVPIMFVIKIGMKIEGAQKFNSFLQHCFVPKQEAQ